MKRWTRIFLIVLPIILIGLGFYFFSDIITYFCIAAVLSLVGRPLVDLLRRIKIKGFQLPLSLCAMVAIATILVTLVLLLSFFIPPLAQQTVLLQRSVNLTDVAQSLAGPIAAIEGIIRRYQLAPEGFEFVPYLQDLIKTFLQTIQVSSLVSGLIGLTGELFIGIFSVAFITFFILRERGILRDMIQALFPHNIESKVDTVLITIRNLLSRYFIGLVIEILLVGVLISIGLVILGVKNAIMIGFFAGLFNVIPYVGPIMGGVLGISFTIVGALDLDFYTGILPLLGKVVVVFVAVQLVDNFVFQPFIYSSSVKAHPLEIFVVILMGANLAGIGGMILAIPVYTILRVVAREFFQQFEIVRSITQRM